MLVDLIATTAFGLEALVKRELAALGYDAAGTSPGRVEFRAELAAICRANLWLRTADRVLLKVAAFPAPDFDALFETTKALPWSDWLPADAAFPVIGRSLKSQLSSVPACQRTVKKAVVESLQQTYGATLPETGPQYKIEIALLKDEATLTIDTTGPSLHKRGYRQQASTAPLKETLAAAMVALSFWNRERPLIDPFCGSGTIPIEAALVGRNLAPGLSREFAAEPWPLIDPSAWTAAREEARDLAQPAFDERLMGTDIDGRALAAARANAERAGVADSVHFQRRDFADLTSKRKYGCVITNPPYGQRLDQDPDLVGLYESFPEVLRKLPTWSHYVLTAYPRFESLVGRSADRRRKLYNGRIECTYYQFHGPRPGEARIRSATPEPAATAESEVPETGGGRTELVEARALEPGMAETEGPATELAEPQTDGTELVEPRTLGTELVEPRVAGVERSEPPEPTPPKPPPTATTRQPLPPVFGGITPKGEEQAELFRRRLEKRARHLRRWPKRGITCFRIYERDIPEIPLIVDRYEDHLHITEYERPHDRDPGQHADWLDLMARTARDTLEIPPGNVFFKRRQRQRGSKQHEHLADERYEVTVAEGGLRFIVNLSDYVDTGLFLDHRVTRGMVRKAAEGANFLNLFAYTGAFSVYAAAGGAKQTTTVDWSNTYLDWARRNMELNEFTGGEHSFVRKSASDFLRQSPELPTYDLAVVDPPTFSNSKRTEDNWDVQRDHVELLNAVLRRMQAEGVVLFSTNFRRFKLDEGALEATNIHEISKQTVPEDFRNRRIHRCWRIVRGP